MSISKFRDKFYTWRKERTLPRNKGYCPICQKETVFIEYKEWLRDNYRCKRCRSIPRQRALVYSLEKYLPGWRNMKIHESSPNGPASAFIEDQCLDYTKSYFYEDIERGAFKEGNQCQDLSNLTFAENEFDLLITQDVFEHVMHPFQAFKEIARVLKPSGAHLFTLPWYPDLRETRHRAKMENGEIKYLLEPVYHNNPVDPKGSLVTFDWGLDFTELVREASGMKTVVLRTVDRNLGLDGEFLEIFMSF